MRERMWLAATCATALLLVAPGQVRADTLRAALSGPFKVQIGVDAQNKPVYQTCGKLNLYKLDGGGREWRLEDTCEEILDVFVPPVITPTPTPGGGGTPIPTPTPRATTSGECTDGMMTKENDGRWTLPNVNLETQRLHTFCFDADTARKFFFEVTTVNKGNFSCSDLEMTVVSPSGVESRSKGPQPGVAPLFEVGRWKLQLFLNWGCNRYAFFVVP